MVKVCTVALVACLAVGTAALRASDALKTVVTSYLEIHALLAADKIDGIKGPAAAILTQATGMGADGTEIAKAAKAMNAAADLKGAREAFGPLSNAIISAAKAEGWKDLGSVKVGFCPMVNRSWLQKDEKIRNPYYGSAMLECGEIKK